MVEPWEPGSASVPWRMLRRVLCLALLPFHVLQPCVADAGNGRRGGRWLTRRVRVLAVPCCTWHLLYKCRLPRLWCTPYLPKRRLSRQLYSNQQTSGSTNRPVDAGGSTSSTTTSTCKRDTAGPWLGVGCCNRRLG